jgi:nitronate monooxygenase
MWPRTRLTELVGIAHPIVQGPFGGGLSTVQLAAAVSNSGGLGSFGAHHLSGAEILEVASSIRRETSAPFALNLWVPTGTEPSPEAVAHRFDRDVERLAPYYAAMGLPLPTLPERFGPAYEEQLEAIYQARPPVFSFIFGVPDARVLAECRRRGITTIGTATNVAEARALAAAGVDAIAASGTEAGGHRASFLRPPEESPASAALVPQVADAVGCPIIAAGGIADGRGVAAALALGADGVQVGTAFLACAESAATEAHRAAIRSDAAYATVLTRAFSGRLARGIRNRFLSELEPVQAELPPYPVQNWLTGPVRRAAAKANRGEFLALWAGQNAPLVKHETARALMAFLVEDTETQLARLAALVPKR